METIQRHPDYPNLSEKYREFVETHEDDVFTVVFDERHGENSPLVCLKEDPCGWLFWTGNLIKVGKSDAEDSDERAEGF
ncbi:hypothetical protein D7X33_14065 [Butyricicoccus sp. 1XD8-22]|nr:hypothetical protein D7X33_14065 [Butyricicoccus sp. 1XD8-22]